jgi:hypothetical protein
MVVAPSPIETVGVMVSESAPYEYTLAVVSRLPLGSSCSQFDGYQVSRRFSGRVEVTVTHLEVAERNVPCTKDLPAVSTEIPLGSDFTPGETYTVVVNGEVTGSFTGRDPEGREMVVAPSPIETVGVMVSESAPYEYTLAVVSRLPLGSSCSQFDGYEVARRFAGQVEVTVTHLEVAERNVPCTRDLPVVSTEIPLGSDFTAGEFYTVVVNGEVTGSFAGRDPEGREMVVAPSPIEAVEVMVSESAPYQYSLAVVSRLPLGSSCSAFNGYDVSRPFAGRVEVTVTHLEVAERNVPCTRDLPVVSTEIPLGSDFTPGESYTIVVNGEEVAELVAE